MRWCARVKIRLVLTLGVLCAIVPLTNLRFSRENERRHSVEEPSVAEKVLGVPEAVIEHLDDADDIKAAAIALVAEHTPHPGSPVEDGDGGLRAELQSLSVKELKHRAKTAGADETSIENLDDADDIKAAAIKLVMGLTRGKVATVEEADPPAAASAVPVTVFAAGVPEHTAGSGSSSGSGSGGSGSSSAGKQGLRLMVMLHGHKREQVSAQQIHLARFQGTSATCGETTIEFSGWHTFFHRCKGCEAFPHTELDSSKLDTASKRTASMLQFMARTYSFDWLFKLDDDAYLYVNNLLHATCWKARGRTTPFYGGFLLRHRHDDGPNGLLTLAAGGAGYLLNAITLEKCDAVGSSNGTGHLVTCGHRENLPLEDVAVALCLSRCGVAVERLDGVYPDTPEKMLEWYRHPDSGHVTPYQLVQNPITYHYIPAERIPLMEFNSQRRIPKRLHQVWVGDSTLAPTDLILQCSKLHPDWEFYLWDEETLSGIKYDSKYQEDGSFTLRENYIPGVGNLLTNSEKPIIADIVRLEVLFRYGGVALDADSVCLRSLNPVLDKMVGYEFGAVFERDDNEDFIANGVQFAVQYSEVVFHGLRSLISLTTARPAWLQTGPCFTTHIIVGQSNCKSWLFRPKPINTGQCNFTGIDQACSLFYNASHQYWQSQLQFASTGRFYKWNSMKNMVSEGGTWSYLKLEKEQTGNLSLHWDHWPAESLQTKDLTRTFSSLSGPKFDLVLNNHTQQGLSTFTISEWLLAHSSVSYLVESTKPTNSICGNSPQLESGRLGCGSTLALLCPTQQHSPAQCLACVRANTEHVRGCTQLNIETYCNAQVCKPASIKIFPSDLFYPYHHRGLHLVGTECKPLANAYTMQRWQSTHASYGREVNRPTINQIRAQHGTLYNAPLPNGMTGSWVVGCAEDAVPWYVSSTLRTDVAHYQLPALPKSATVSPVLTVEMVFPVSTNTPALGVINCTNYPVPRDVSALICAAHGCQRIYTVQSSSCDSRYHVEAIVINASILPAELRVQGPSLVAPIVLLRQNRRKQLDQCAVNLYGVQSKHCDIQWAESHSHFRTLNAENKSDVENR